MEEYIVKVYKDRTEWYNKANQHHRLDGPAVEYANGDKAWWLNGQLHRSDGPAVEDADGEKFWYKEGKLHRLDGPAVEWANGGKHWYKNGQLHRLDGPAVEYADGDKEWWVDGNKYTKKAFLEKTQPATELTVVEIAKRLGINNLKIVKE